MFCVQLYGKRARWGRYNLYFEALKPDDGGYAKKKKKKKKKKTKKQPSMWQQWQTHFVERAS